MSGSHYHITYTQILESERRLQLSNILKLFSIKLSSGESDKPISLKNYLNTFVENDTEQGVDSNLELSHYLETLLIIPDFQISSSQLECLTYVAGYAVFSYMKKSNKCLDCQNFLTIDKHLELVNDVGSQYILVDLLDRGSLKYPSLAVIECVNTIYETFIKIDTSEILCNKFYIGPCRVVY